MHNFSGIIGKITASNSKVTWIIGADSPEVDWAEAEDAGVIVVSHLVTDRSFLPYTAISSIITQLINTFEERYPAEIERVRRSYHKLMNEWQNTDLSSDSVLYSIIRRISRETMATARLIDGLIIDLVFLIRKVYENERKRLILCLDRVEWLDRPSIRILYRLNKLLPSSHFGMIWFFHDSIADKSEAEIRYDDMLGCINVARNKIFTRLAVDFQPDHINLRNVNPTSYKTYQFIETKKDLLANAALALVTQNYEYAYLTCNESLKLRYQLEDVFRIIGLAHTNLGLIDKAYDAFCKAIELVRSGPKRAHLEYLCGLLATKRFYNLEMARRHYETGMKFVNESDAQNRLEKGWILNGLSFLDVVAASKLDMEEKHKLLEKALRRELEALKIVKNDKGTGPLYLRYNLYSNIAFLLEIKQEYRHALSCWKRSFTKFFGENEDKYKNFGAAYFYRTGMLSWKAGDIQEGLQLLRKARDIARKIPDRLYQELICYGWGYVALHEGFYEDASEAFLDGFILSVNMCEWEKARQHAVGYLKSGLVQGKFSDYVCTLRQQENEALCRDPNLYDFLHKQEEQLITEIQSSNIPQPKTKLSSYYPSIDLEEVPKVDMNLFLISQNPHSLIIKG